MTCGLEAIEACDCNIFRVIDIVVQHPRGRFAEYAGHRHVVEAVDAVHAARDALTLLLVLEPRCSLGVEFLPRSESKNVFSLLGFRHRSKVSVQPSVSLHEPICVKGQEEHEHSHHQIQCGNTIRAISAKSDFNSFGRDVMCKLSQIEAKSQKRWWTLTISRWKCHR